MHVPLHTGTSPLWCALVSPRAPVSYHTSTVCTRKWIFVRAAKSTVTRCTYLCASLLLTAFKNVPRVCVPPSLPLSPCAVPFAGHRPGRRQWRRNRHLQCESTVSGWRIVPFACGTVVEVVTRRAGLPLCFSTAVLRHSGTHRVGAATQPTATTQPTETHASLHQPTAPTPPVTQPTATLLPPHAAPGLPAKLP